MNHQENTNNTKQLIEFPKYVRYLKSRYEENFYQILIKKLLYKHDLVTSIKLLSKRICKGNLKRFITRTLKYFESEYTIDEIHQEVIKVYKYEPKKYNMKTFTITKEIKKEITNSIQEKAKQKNLSKLGVEHPFQSNKIQDKVKQVTYERYGFTSLFFSDEFQEKIKGKTLKKYGVVNMGGSEESLVKIMRYHINKYSLIEVTEKDLDKLKLIFSYVKSFVITDKSLLKTLKKYNDFIFDSRKRAKITNIKRFGADNVFASKIYKDYILQHNLEKYKRESHTQIHIKNYENLNENFVKYVFTDDKYFYLKKFCSYFNVKFKTAIKYKEKFGIDKTNYIFNCWTQRQIFEKIKTNNKILNNRKIIYPFEIDIVLPDIKLGIEYNGLMYHSEGFDKYSKFRNKDKNYHLDKLELCNLKGYDLFHIFESDNIDIWISMINNRLGVNERIYARKCIIKELKSTEIKDFLNNNHLQGFINSSINLGLYHNDELVSVMTFSKPRFNKKYDYELIRFCNKLNTSVIGSASKLFNYFIKNYNPKSIISYANRRFSNGSIYEKLGFKFLRKTEPNYFYFKPNDVAILMSRNQFQKHKLKDKLNIYNPELSESENMFNNGYRRIYDCGNLVYEYHYN